MTLVFLPAADIATYVGEGNVDIGITGQDIVAESDSKVVELLQLGFGRCELGVQAPVKGQVTSPAQLAGKRIVTSFPNIAREYFKQFELDGQQTSECWCCGHSCCMGMVILNLHDQISSMCRVRSRRRAVWGWRTASWIWSRRARP